MHLVYAVIDTNVFISALITKNSEASTVKVVEAVLKGDIVPLYHEDIIAEYDEVLHREKFKIDDVIPTEEKLSPGKEKLIGLLEEYLKFLTIAFKLKSYLII